MPQTALCLPVSTTTESDLVACSADYLGAVRRGQPTDEYRTRLAGTSFTALRRDLPTDDHKCAFWLNVYNAAVQDVLTDDPGRFSRWRFFRKPLLVVANRELSPDDIEHGLLRRSQTAWGLGYVPKPLPSGFERGLRVESVDPRIHFALNCGAASCPAIEAYSAADIDVELDLAAETYLSTEVAYDPDRNVARVPRLCRWYRGDFGGPEGVRRLLRRYDAIPADADPRLTYADYDWDLSLGNYR
jgi:hypothetical protein